MAPITLSAAAVNEAIYVALATAKGDIATDIVAGITGEMLSAHPNLSANAIRAAVTELDGAVAANRPDPASDISPNDAIRMSRVLARVVPALTRPELRDGARRYTQLFMRGCRRGSGRLRQVAPLELQFDRTGEVDKFRRDSWQRLHQLAISRPAVGQALDQGPIAAALGFETRLNAAALLERVPLRPLRDFVVPRLQPNGRLVLDLADVDPFVAGISAEARSLRDGYAENLITINRAEQKARDATAVIRGRGSARSRADEAAAGSVLAAAAESELAKACKAADAKQETLDKKLEEIRQGVKGGLGAAAFLVRAVDDEFANDITEFASISDKMLVGMRDFAKAAISTAKFVDKVLSASKDALFAGGGVGFAFVMVALMIQVTGLFGSRQKPITQIILEELRKVSQQITDLRDEMRVRFDRIETKLDTIYEGILDRLAEIDFTLGEVKGDVAEMQLSLYNLHAQLQRLNRDVHAFLAAGHRRELVETINGFLNFEELTGEPLDFAGFRTAENLFYSWGKDHAKDALQAGPEDRGIGDDDLFPELTGLPLATNINYLRVIPAKFDLPELAADRLANPFDWIVAAEAYAQLSEESPAHANRMSPTRVADLFDVGEALGTSLSKIDEIALFCHLAGHYQMVFTRLKATINTVERDYRRDPNHRLFAIDLWGGADQEPAEHFFQDEFEQLPRCGGGGFDSAHATVPSNVFPFDHGQLRPYMIAGNLSTSKIPGIKTGLAKLSACVEARWRTISVEELGLGGLVRVTYRLSILVHIRYGQSVVFTHRFDTPEQIAPAIPKDDLDTFNPATDSRGKNPYPLLVSAEKNLWAKLDTFPATHSVVDPDRLAATTALVEDKLKLVQRAFYAEIARRFTADGDQLQILAQRLTGSKLLWQSLVTAGLPLSAEANEILRSLLFGSESILGGVGTEGATSRLDNLRNIYAFFSTRAEDPLPANILGEIEDLARDRVNQLLTIVLEIVDEIQNGGRPPQPPELFAPTLLRLSLIRPTAQPLEGGPTS